VLGFGAKAVILKPEWLRREVVEELRAMRSAYAVPDAAADRTTEETPAPADVNPESSRKADVGRRARRKR
jgi:hypothetical protein